jgi:hypothetical protein
LGTKAFVATELARRRRKGTPPSRSAPDPLPNLTDWGKLTTLRKLRGSGFG